MASWDIPKGVKINVRQEKILLRARYKKRREAIAHEHRRRMDEAVLRRMLSLRSYALSNNILLYHPIDGEVDLMPLAEAAIKAGKRVYFPVTRDEGLMDFYRVTDLEHDFVEGRFGIREPSEERCEILDRDAFVGSSIVIMPALSFDREGYRLGYGRGYYDRYLIDFQATVIGVVYDELLADDLPRGKYDRHADLVVTDKRILMVTK